MNDNLNTFRKALDIVELVRHNPNESLTNLSLKIEQMINQERRAAAEAMRETCATVVEGWHIRKGGYTELSHVLRSIDTPDDGRG